MKEKKQTNQLSYSAFGKHFRGFLCMVTFTAFCVSAMLSAYAVGAYGTNIVINPAYYYTETMSYQSELSSEIANVLEHCDVLNVTNIPYREISIMDVGNQDIHYYSKELMGEDVYYGTFIAGYLSDLEVYEEEEALQYEDADLMDYAQMRDYLEKGDYPCDYLYFDKDTFRNMFEENGLQNTDYRFSGDFSEEAYFVFENYEVTTRKTLDGEETIATTEVNTEETPAEATTEVAVDEEETTEAATVTRETVTQTEIVITPYNMTSYAVYDPEQDVYYSTEDDYFDEMETYIYRTDELLSYIQEQEADGTYYNSLVIPLLRNCNYGLYDLAWTQSDLYATMLSSQSVLDECVERGIYYSLQTDDSICYTNLNGKKMEDLERVYYYRFEKESNDTITQSHSADVPDLQDIYAIEESFDAYPVGSVFYLGFQDYTSILWNTDKYSLGRRNEEYPFFRDYSLLLVVVAVVSLILLLVQAVLLIRTTGRKYKGDKEVSLNFFDRFYTEAWAVISAGIMIASIACVSLCVDEMYTGVSLGSLTVWTSCAALVFGFCFMVLTLSFARRLKAHNIWSRLALVKLAKVIMNKLNGDNRNDENVGETKSSVIMEKCSQLWNRCKQVFYEMQGTRKLLIVFVAYMIVEITIVLFIVTNNANAGVAVFLFMLLQCAALAVVVWVVKDIDKLTEGVGEITQGNLDGKVEINEKISVFGELADGINHIGDGLKSAVETSLKDERMKTELITNVSHDLKTPLTSIINYIDLLKKEEIPGDDAKHYIEVLDAKSQRLKQLTEDLVEAAKATSGNIELEMMPLTFDELMKQALGEFEDKYEKKNLTIIASYPEEPAVVLADGRRLFRIIENVLQNIYKYAMEGTRVYADLSKDEEMVTFTLKNVSAAPLNISADELMERFTRGDSSRTTEGSGLGLSIAKDLTRLQNGEFEIQLDGDLFKVIIRFPEHK